MQHAQTIAMARGLLAEGRAADVARMLEPLVERAEGPLAPASEPGRVVLHALLARVRLLRYGDPREALALLAPFDDSALRAQLAPALRAEVALWLGWAHAWQDVRTYDDARALNLLDEAGRLFRDELNPGGRCWTLLGQARAYLTIDEYPLLERALDEAEALQEKLPDRQAQAWIHDLRVTTARYHGHYAQAQTHVDALLRLGQALHDPHALGRGQAYQAVLYHELGRAPDAVVAEATEAAHLLSHSAACAGYPYLVTAHAHLGALLRKGAWADADRLAAAMAAGAADLPTAPAYLAYQQAVLALYRGDTDRARHLLDDILHRVHRQHRLLIARTCLLRAELLQRREASERAIEWAERAFRLAREAGHAGLEIHARLALARIEVDRGAADAARALLQEAERHTPYFSLLPLAAPRFHLLGRLAGLEGSDEDARAHLAQALSAYSLVGDVYHTARLQVELARLSRQADPLHGRPLLDAALVTFTRLQAEPDVREARALTRSWPAHQGVSNSHGDPAVGAALARAAVSVDLAAEAWLQAFEPFLPDRWLAVYRVRDDDGWQLVHAHGTPPPHPAFPDPGADVAHTAGVAWVRLRRSPGPVFFFAAPGAEADAVWRAAYERMKPWLPVVGLALDHALLRARRLDGDAAAGEAPVSIPLADFVHASPSMREVTRQIARIRASHSPVLITGESGTGKELIARAVHATSERHDAPFVAFNCSTVPHELFDSHLFGHEKGAFTGATRAHQGVVRAAEGGTLFLDEIGDLPLDVQPKLLRFLQEGEVFPLGARRPVQVNVRVVAATNQDLEGLIREGRFREDLYYRLNVVPLRVPPLRDRREEIPLLVRHFLAALRPAGAPLVSITNRALDALLHYPWPGNVRQLRNEVERALVFVSSEPAPLIDLKDLSPAVTGAAGRRDGPDAGAVRPAVPPSAASNGEDGRDLDDVLAGTEKAVIERILAEHAGRITASADVLGLTRQGLYKKMKRLGIDSARFRTPTSA